MRFRLSTNNRQELIDITSRINEAIKQSKAESGLCNVFALHATAGIIINENYDPNICTDFLDAINKAIPDNAGYKHDRIDGNAGAHIKAAILSPEITIPIREGKLLLGTWQSVMLVELDGPRKNREIEVTIVKG